MNKLQQNYEILSSAKCGIEFEFFTEMSPKEVAKDVSLALGKKVTIPVVIKGFGEESKAGYHSEFEPTSTVFKLERDFSGGKDMYEMITGPLVYEEARLIIIKMHQWIKQKGWTDPKSAIHLNVSFDSFKSKTRDPLINLNPLKFILGFDEEFIYERFPERRDSVYAKSINNYYPVNRFVFFDSPENIDRNDYVTPNEKYYGVNFTKLPKGYLEIHKLHNCLQHNDSYSQTEKDKLHKKLKSQKTAVQSFSDPDRFLLNYPNIIVSIDMKGDVEIIKAYWTLLREMLFNLIVDSGMRKGHLNFDTDMSIFQLRDAILRKVNHLLNLELFDCDVSGTMTECVFYRCKINSSRIDHCKILEINEIKNSKIQHSTIKNGNTITNSYIENPEEIIDGKIDGGVIRKGIIGKNAEISSHTLIVDSTSQGDKKDTDSYHDAFSK